VRSDRLAFSLFALLHGCGAPLAAANATAEAEGPAEPALPEAPIELSIHVPFAGFIEIGELRGRAGLLFFFSTFDNVSQAMLTPLALVIEAHPESFFVGIAVQPDARILVDAWAHALEPPLPVGWEPKDTVTTDRSPVGIIDTVPTIVSVDAFGRPVERAQGLLQARELDEMLTRAIERGRGATKEGR
jgi:hypothetical protein